MEDKCLTCPRKCNVNRQYVHGFCNENEQISIAKVIEHFPWEEPCFSDERGVLAIFFSGCNLKCDYCQNHEISRGGVGKTYSIDEFVKLVEEKQTSHCAIDLITPTHFSSALCLAFEKIKKTVPIIWNTNAYETTQNIAHVSKFVDIFLPDFKYASDELGQKFSSCKDYFSFALPAIKEMCAQKRDLFVDCQNVTKDTSSQDNLDTTRSNFATKQNMKQGVVIRHLVLPGHVENSLKVLDEISKNFPGRMISIMSQFTPNGKSTLNRKITPLEYKLVLSHMEKLGLEKGFVQSFESADNCFVPNFS